MSLALLHNEAATTIERLEDHIVELQESLRKVNAENRKLRGQLRREVTKLANEKSKYWKAFGLGVQKENAKLRKQLAHAIKELSKPKSKRPDLTQQEWLVLLGDL